MHSRLFASYFGGFVAISGVLSCGGSVERRGGATATGTVSGVSVPTTDVVGLIEPAGGGFTLAGVAYTNVGDTCGIIQREASGGPEPANTVVLSLTVQVAGSSVPAGTYSINGQPGLFADFVTTDANCQTHLHPNPTSGSVTFTTISSSMVAGTFDVTFGTDRVTGTFSAPVCNVPQGPSNMMPKCGL